ncbi:hypothetical protein ACJBU6_06712 [Exserohilum turcicum]
MKDIQPRAQELAGREDAKVPCSLQDAVVSMSKCGRIKKRARALWRRRRLSSRLKQAIVALKLHTVVSACPLNLSTANQQRLVFTDMAGSSSFSMALDASSRAIGARLAPVA